MKNIASALVKAQRDFGPALKTSSNPLFRTRYADLSVCIEAVIDALNNNGIFVLQKTHDCDDGVKVETIFIHESGEEISCGIIYVPATKKEKDEKHPVLTKDPHAFGSALTYARRYSLMAACGIAPEDDDGNAASRKSDGYKEFEDKHLPAFREKALKGVAALEEAHRALPPSPHKSTFWNTWGDIFKPAAEKNNGATKSDRLADTLVA
jgi:hypothetical protein